MPVSAILIDPSQIETTKFIEIYKKFFEKEFVVDLNASSSEINAAQSKRNMIIDYMASNDMVVSDADIHQAWQDYIKKNFKSIDQFAKYLEQGYMKESELKERFKQNIYFSRYFSEIIMPRIQDDIEARKKIFELAEKKQIDISDNDFKEALYQMAENWGGTDAFNVFLENNQFSLVDISFLLKSEMLKEKLITTVIDEGLKQDSQLAETIEQTAQNHYQNLNYAHKPIYHFKHAYIEKHKDGSSNKIKIAHSNFKNKKKLDRLLVNDKEIIVEDVAIPLDPKLELYDDNIKSAILSLGKDGLFVTNEISPVISSGRAYHIFQLTSIEVPEPENYSQIRSEVISGLEKEHSKDFHNLVNELLLKI